MGLDAMGDGIKPRSFAPATPPVATPLSAGRVQYHTSLQKHQHSNKIQTIAYRPVPSGRYAGRVHLDPRVGLCSVCRHARVVVSGRGSRFYLCSRSAADPGFRKYPPLPVRECRGFEHDNPPDDQPPSP